MEPSESCGSPEAGPASKTVLPSCWQKNHSWWLVPRATPPKRTAEERSRDFQEIYSNFDEETVRIQASRCIQCPQPQCRVGCPLSNRIPEWLALAAEGLFLEAAEISQSTSNIPELCSRVCPQEKLCEGACILNARTEPVAIGAIERFINEYAFTHGGVDTSAVESNGMKVAVIGSGPGGLSCADQLVRLGYSVTVFESQRLLGGLLMNGIPAFKLDKGILDRRIQVLRDRGVQFKPMTQVGKDVSFEDLRSSFDAIFLAFGAQKPKALDVPGAYFNGIHEALPFLVEKNSGECATSETIDIVGKRVVVLGGGDTAMDCLRTAIRSGAKEAICVYRRDLANMPGSKKEYANALEEGARFLFLTNPVQVSGDEVGNVRSVKCTVMELGEPDASGRRTPRVIPGSEFEIEADVILVAYGFDAVPLAQSIRGIKADQWGRLQVDSTQMTTLPGVFSGGDTTRGPSLVVHAVKDGRRAADGIHNFLMKKKLSGGQSNATQHCLVA